MYTTLEQKKISFVYHKTDLFALYLFCEDTCQLFITLCGCFPHLREDSFTLY